MCLWIGVSEFIAVCSEIIPEVVRGWPKKTRNVVRILDLFAPQFGEMDISPWFFSSGTLIMSHWSKKAMPKHKTWKSSWHFLVSAKDPFKLYIPKTSHPENPLGAHENHHFLVEGPSINSWDRLQLRIFMAALHLGDLFLHASLTCPFLWAGELEVGTWLFYGFPKIEKHQGGWAHT